MKTRRALPQIVCASLIAPLASIQAETADQVKITPSRDRMRVELNGRLFTEYIFRRSPRPYLYPVLAADGTQLNRDYPMKEAPGEETDHPHHRSLWFAHGAVNGIDFWSDGLGKGTIVSESVTPSVAGGVGTIRARDRWVGPDGALCCTDTTTIRFRGGPEWRTIDFEITLEALPGRPLLLGDTKEGSMSLRVAQWMTMTHAYHKNLVPGLGRIVTSTGRRDAAAWGQRADWCDYFAPRQGKIYGVAIFDHPQNPRHPTWWMARDYGLFGANPFGRHDYEGLPDQPHIGDYLLPHGRSLTLRYRFFFHLGDQESARIAERYRDYADSR